MNIRVKAIVLIFSGLCSLGSLNGQIPMGVTHSEQSTSQAPFPLTQYTTPTYRKEPYFHSDSV